jgi:predicted PurR-regulated permease PerM
MRKEHIFLIFILLLTFFSFYFLYRILAPFLEPILWAIITAMVLFPAFRRLYRLLRKRQILSAMVMTFLVVVIIILPFSLLLFSLVNEIVSGYHRVEEMIQAGTLKAYWEKVQSIPVLHLVLARVDRTFHLSTLDPLDFFLKNIRQVTNFLFNQSTTVLKGLSGFVVGFFFTLLSLYYLFKDGDQLFERVKGTIPLPPGERDLLIRRFQEMVRATILGGLLIALIQGLLGGLAFWVLGLQSPVLWGTAMALFSFIPVGGTALIWGPAALILFVTGYIAEGIILLAIGVVVISSVDNFLRPYFISSRTNIHPLLLFFVVLGGIQAFGMIGIVLGPLIATVCLTLIEIYTQGIQAERIIQTGPSEEHS